MRLNISAMAAACHGDNGVIQYMHGSRPIARSNAELTQVVIRVPVGPPLPITDRHRSKEPVSGIEGARSSLRDPLEARDRPRQVIREVRRPGTFSRGLCNGL